MTTGDVLLVAAIVLIPAALLWVTFLVRSGRPGRPTAVLGIPLALRPAEPDEVLEGPRLQRIQIGWIAATLATAVFIPAYWLPETNRQAAYEERFSEESLHRGQLIFAVPPQLEEDAAAEEFREAERALSLGQGCAGCHGPAEVPEGQPRTAIAAGGFANPCNVCPVDPISGRPSVKYQAPPLNNVFQRWDEEVVRFTIERGRPGTPMPAWGVDYGGSMTDLMIDDVMAWLKTLPGNQTPPPELPDICQDLPLPETTPTPGETPDLTAPPNEEADATTMRCGKAIFEARCAVCHGPQGQGQEQPPDKFVNPDGTPEATWYQGLALWKGDVTHLTEAQHLQTIRNGRRFAFMPQFAEAPAQGIPVPPYPLTDAQMTAVMAYERTL